MFVDYSFYHFFFVLLIKINDSQSMFFLIVFTNLKRFVNTYTYYIQYLKCILLIDLNLTRKTCLNHNVNEIAHLKKQEKKIKTKKFTKIFEKCALQFAECTVYTY